MYSGDGQSQFLGWRNQRGRFQQKGGRLLQTPWAAPPTNTRDPAEEDHGGPSSMRNGSGSLSPSAGCLLCQVTPVGADDQQKEVDNMRRFCSPHRPVSAGQCDGQACPATGPSGQIKQSIKYPFR